MWSGPHGRAADGASPGRSDLGSGADGGALPLVHTPFRQHADV
eukprot:gene13065-48294_t